MVVVVQRFDVYLSNLDPTIGSEIQQTRPCLVISPDEMNRHIRTVIIAPLTSSRRAYPTRVDCDFGGKQGQIVLDQIRTVDRSRLVKKLGVIPDSVQADVLSGLAEVFAH